MGVPFRGSCAQYHSPACIPSVSLGFRSAVIALAQARRPLAAAAGLATQSNRACACEPWRALPQLMLAHPLAAAPRNADNQGRAPTGALAVARREGMSLPASTLEHLASDRRAQAPSGERGERWCALAVLAITVLAAVLVASLH